MRTSRTLACIAAAACALTACVSEQGTKGPAPVRWGQSSALDTSVSAARWVYLPSRANVISAELAVDAQHTLFVDVAGDRWLRDNGSRDVTVAVDRAPSTLNGVLRQGDSFLFVSANEGVVYEAGSPLGAFREVRRSPEPFARLVASESSLLAITRQGALVRSTDGGLRYVPVHLDGMGVAGDVAMMPGGTGLLLAYPEKLFLTRDGGASWSAVTAPTIGASDIKLVDEGRFFVHGHERHLLLARGASRVQVLDKPPEISVEPPDVIEEQLPGPQASCIETHHGVMAGGRTITVNRSQSPTEPWQIVDAKLGERAKPAALTGSEGCRQLVIAESQGFLYGACATQLDTSLPVSVSVRRWKTPDSAEQLAFALQGSHMTLALSVAADGSLLISGACREGEACDRKEPLLLRGQHTKWAPLPAFGAAPAASSAPSPWVVTSVPQLTSFPWAMQFSPNGARAYVIAQRGKSDELSLFVSRDGGQTFEPRDVFGVVRDADDREQAVRSLQISTVDEGIVSLGLETDAGPWFVVTDQDGQVLNASQPPSMSSGAHIGVAGRHALGVDGRLVIESLDGGISWRSLGEFNTLEASGVYARLDAVACAPEGCLIGAAVARIGWGGTLPPAPKTVQAALDARSLGAGAATQSLAALRCQLGAGPWTPLPRGAPVPNVKFADRGNAAWAVAGTDPARASAVMSRALVQPAGKIEDVALLPPVRDASKHKVFVVNDALGAAAGRYRARRYSDGSEDLSVSSMELGWENLIENKRSRVTLPRIHLESYDIETSGDGLDPSAHGGLLSITSGGVFIEKVRHFEEPSGLFVDHAGRADRVPLFLLPRKYRGRDPLDFRLDEFELMESGLIKLLRVSGKSVALTLLNESTSVERRGSNEERRRTSLFSSTSEGDSKIAFTYQNGEPLLVHSLTMPGGAQETHLLAVRSDGDVLGSPLRGPSQSTLSQRFRICDEQDRAKTPRVVAPANSRSHYVVLIENTDGARFAAMRSGDMVLYGTGESPCAGSLEAIAVLSPDTPEARTDDRAIVRMNDLEHAWYFRIGKSALTEMRPMRCSVDPQLELTERVMTKAPAKAGPGKSSADGAIDTP